MVVNFGKRVKFDILIPEDIIKISNIFKNYEFQLLIIGGAVRDSLLNITPKDYDLVTDAIPDKVEEIMKTAGIKTIPTGKAFGVINVFIGKNEYEIATMRADVGSDGRRPNSVIFSDINTDSQRRDYSCNALYYDLVNKEIIDLVGGIEDIKNGIIRTVGLPEDRFKEDKLRVMRGIRLSARFGSNLDPAIDTALQKDASLCGISGERIRDEFIKGIISAKSVKKFLQMIDKYKLFDWIFPGLNIDKNFIEDKDPIIVIAGILKNNSPDTLGKKLNGLKYSAEEVKAITFLVALLKLSIDTSVMLKKTQKHAGVIPEQMKDFGEHEGIDMKLLDAFIKFELSVTGPEIMNKLNIKPGPELGKAIHEMETDNFKKLL